jgi:hypothetical protein
MSNAQRIKTALRNAGEAMAPELQSFKEKLGAGDKSTAVSKTKSGGTGVDLGSIFIASSNPRWVRDDESDDCLLCGSTFGLMLRRHHCRLCGQLVCGSCSSHQISSKRVCDTCFSARLFPSARVAPSLANFTESNSVATGSPTTHRIPMTVAEEGGGEGNSKEYVTPDALLMPFGKLRARLHHEQRQPITTSVTDQRNYSVLNFAHNALDRLKSMEAAIRQLKPLPLRTR